LGVNLQHLLDHFGVQSRAARHVVRQLLGEQVPRFVGIAVDYHLGPVAACHGSHLPVAQAVQRPRGYLDEHPGFGRQSRLFFCQVPRVGQHIHVRAGDRSQVGARLHGFGQRLPVHHDYHRS